MPTGAPGLELKKKKKKKRLAWKSWSEDLNRSEKQIAMFRIAKQMKKERKDVIGAKYIMDERGDIKIQKEEIMGRWRSYFKDLLNEENEHHLEEMGKVEG